MSKRRRKATTHRRPRTTRKNVSSQARSASAAGNVHKLLPFGKALAISYLRNGVHYQHIFTKNEQVQMNADGTFVVIHCKIKNKWIE